MKQMLLFIGHLLCAQSQGHLLFVITFIMIPVTEISIFIYQVLCLCLLCIQLHLLLSSPK